MSQEDEHIPEWAKKMQGCIDDLNSKVGNLDSKVTQSIEIGKSNTNSINELIKMIRGRN